MTEEERILHPSIEAEVRQRTTELREALALMKQARDDELARSASTRAAAAYARLHELGYAVHLNERSEAVEVYREDCVRTPVTRNGHNVGWRTRTPLQMRAAVFFRLIDAAKVAGDAGNVKLRNYYNDGWLALVEVWKVRRISRDSRTIEEHPEGTPRPLVGTHTKETT